MSAFSFGILTDISATVRDFFIARDFMKIENGELVGVRAGVEWREPFGVVPVPLSGTGTEADPYVYTTDRLFIFKVEHAARYYEIEGEAQTDAEGNPRLIWQRTRLGKIILANSTAFSFTDAMGRTFRGRKVNGQNIRLLREDDLQQIHDWQS